jgi:hypothetical protein
MFSCLTLTVTKNQTEIEQWRDRARSLRAIAARESDSEWRRAYRRWADEWEVAAGLLERLTRGSHVAR